MSTIRAFFAVELDDATRRRLAEVLSRFEKRLGKGVTWVAPEKLHVTMKFLGDVKEQDPPKLLEVARDVVDDIAPFEVDVTGLGTFGGRRPRVVWAGVADSRGRLRYVYEQLEARLVAEGWPREPKRYHPHVTLGRVRKRIDAQALDVMVDEARDTLYGHVPVGKLTLYRSTLTRDGSVYEVIDTAALTG